MTAQIRTKDGTARAAHRSERRGAVRRLTSIPALAALVLLFTLGAIGPLQRVDEAVNQPWRQWYLSGAGPALADLIDPLASQKVAVPLLGLVAAWLSWRRRNLRPLVSAAIAELGVVCLGGAMKLFFARSSPKFLDPAFFSGGLLVHGWGGISYPSGHAMEAVAVYGTLTMLVARHGPASRWVVGCLIGLTVFVAAITVVQSFYMGWHWMTDLVGGSLTGLLILRVVSTADHKLSTSSVAAAHRTRSPTS